MPKPAKFCPMWQIFTTTLIFTLASTFDDSYASKQLYLLCRTTGSNKCTAFSTQQVNVDIFRPIRRLRTNCGLSDLKPATPFQKFIQIQPFEGKRIILCKINNIFLGPNKQTFSRKRRETSFRGRYRGQTQSQYLSLNGEGKDDGKAEALSKADTSRASVSGKSGMGQAQSQSMYDPSCEECYSRSDPGADSLKRVPFGTAIPDTVQEGTNFPSQGGRYNVPGQRGTGYGPGQGTNSDSGHGLDDTGDTKYGQGPERSGGATYRPGQGAPGSTTYGLDQSPTHGPGQGSSSGATHGPSQGSTYPGQGKISGPSFKPAIVNTVGTTYGPGQGSTGGQTYGPGQGRIGLETYAPGQGGTAPTAYVPGQGMLTGATYGQSQDGNGGAIYGPSLGNTAGQTFGPRQGSTGRTTFVPGQGRPTQGNIEGATYNPSQGNTGDITFSQGQGSSGVPTYGSGQESLPYGPGPGSVGGTPYSSAQGNNGAGTYGPGQGRNGGPVHDSSGGPKYGVGQGNIGGSTYGPAQGNSGSIPYIPNPGTPGGTAYHPVQGSNGGITYTPGQGNTGGSQTYHSNQGSGIPTYGVGNENTGATFFSPGHGTTGGTTYIPGQGNIGSGVIYGPGQGTVGTNYGPIQGTPGGTTYGTGKGDNVSPTYKPGQAINGVGTMYGPGQTGTGVNTYGPNSGGAPYSPGQGSPDGTLYGAGQDGNSGKTFIPGHGSTSGINYGPGQNDGLNKVGVVQGVYNTGLGGTNVPTFGTQPTQVANWPTISGSFPGPGGLNYYCCVVSPNNNPQYLTVQGNGENIPKNIEQTLINKFNSGIGPTHNKYPQGPFGYITGDGKQYNYRPEQGSTHIGSFDPNSGTSEAVGNNPGQVRINTGSSGQGIVNTGGVQTVPGGGVYSPSGPGLGNNGISTQDGNQPAVTQGQNQMPTQYRPYDGTGNTPTSLQGNIPGTNGGYASPDAGNSRHPFNVGNEGTRIDGQSIPRTDVPYGYDSNRISEGNRGNINQIPTNSLNSQYPPPYNSGFGTDQQGRPAVGQTPQTNVHYDSNGAPIYNGNFGLPGGNIHVTGIGGGPPINNYGNSGHGPYGQNGNPAQPSNQPENQFNNNRETNGYNNKVIPGQATDFTGHAQYGPGAPSGQPTNQPGKQFFNPQRGTGTDGYDQGGPGQNIDLSGAPHNVVDPNSIAGSLDDDSEALAIVSQDINGTLASASSKGGSDKGRAQTQVQGTYTGSGSFSAQAQITDENKGAESEVSGGKKGASSSAQGRGRNNKSQAGVQLGSETGSLQTQAQSDSVAHSSNSQVQGSVKGGMADAQAKGPGSTSSQAQIGFTPYKAGDKSHELIKGPFVGSGTASAQSSGRIGQSQTQLQGTFKYGISYTGAAQSGSSLDKDAVFPNRLNFNKINVFDETNKNIDVNADHSLTTTELPPLPLVPVDETVIEKDETLKNSESSYSSHTHLDHHKTEIPTTISPTDSSPITNRRSFQPAFSNNGADYEYDKEDNAPDDYDPDNVDGEHSEYNYDDFPKYPDNTHQSLSSNKKTLDIKQSNKGSTQHILLGGLNAHDAKIIQKSSEQPNEGKIYQPGERVPGTGGYTIPIGFTGSIQAVSSKEKTYAIGLPDSPSQAQSVTLTPGTGKVRYEYPQIPSISKNVNRHDLRSLNPKVDDSNKYVSVSKSVTGALDGDNNIKKQYSHTYYTKSSSCGYFTFTCTMVSGSNGRKKVCRPKVPTNPDGTPIRC